MELLKIDGQLLKKMIVSAAGCLQNNKSAINALNVFPVPDGDTGTNMSMTLNSALKEVQEIKIDTVPNVANAAANGSLMGARGNSGVILSQLLRGFARQVREKESIDARDFSNALKEGADTAYKAVMKPTEGTILTVARETADKAVELSKSINEIDLLMNNLVEYAQSVLDKTPEMLPVLKKAGVVDSGGMGLIYIYKGIQRALRGEDVKISDIQPEAQEEHVQETGVQQEIKYGYCTEFIIKNTDYDVQKFRQHMVPFGDSQVIVGDSGIIKVHIHTNDPGKVLSEAIKLGELTRIKIDNMREQHRSIIDFNNQDVKDDPVPSEDDDTSDSLKAGVITVASGEGIKNIFKDLGACNVIEGGQTMNPSTEDILNAINAIKSDEIYILPNNGNIIMAAKQAATLSDKNVYVIPSKTIPQGISALTVFNPENKSKENIEIMTSTMNYVKTGQVTYAVRNTIFDDKEIKQGDILGLLDGKISCTGRNILQVAEDLIQNMVSDDDELITILYGKDASKDDAEKLADTLKNKYKNCEIQSYSGGQPLYYFIISVE
ncbi:MAG: DAK2 domain-containing protein [Clostridiales bacterium]|nr:DAK2 domain-containing protein [Clostridiales bacterium]